MRELRSLGSAPFASRMGERYGIRGASASTAFGVPMSEVQRLAKRVRKDHAAARKAAGLAKGASKQLHDLARALWETGQYEARMVAIFLAEPALVTGAMMDAWARDCDNWAHADTMCFKLFDAGDAENGHALAFSKARAWATRKEEFVKRSAFALIASLALHVKASTPAIEARFRACLPLIELGASDDRNFVKKGVSWALRGLGNRARSRDAAVALARRLATSAIASARWIGKDALRDIER